VSAKPDARPSILLVDDDDIFRRRLARALTDRGYRVDDAPGYDEAMRAAARNPPQRAVLDLRMVGRSGIELLQDLVALVPTVQVVVLTGYGSIATAVQAIRLGAVDYVSKPADADDVLAAFGAAADPAPTEAFERPSLARMEWEYIQKLLAECGGNVSEAARRLGMHRRTLQRKLGKYPPEPR
jgi:two-component system response regulator RegA